MRAEPNKTGGTEGQWTQRIQRGRHSCRDAHGQARVSGGGCAQPSGIKMACGIGQTIVPELFQSSEICSFGFRSVTRRRHISCRPLGDSTAEDTGRKQRKQGARKAKEQADQCAQTEKCRSSRRIFYHFNQGGILGRMFLRNRYVAAFGRRATDALSQETSGCRKPSFIEVRPDLVKPFLKRDRLNGGRSCERSKRTGW